jgi:hypothetical protein
MITKLVSENFKRVRAVTIEPDGAGAVIVAGNNDQGKSSGGCDAIAFALGGAKHAPGEPLRRGAKKGGVVLETDDLIVTRSITKKGSTLTVTGKDGARFASPQKMLDSLLGPLSFDPTEFERMKAPEQAKVISGLAGLDFADENVARQEAYDKRTIVKREIKRLQGAVDSMQDVPAEAPAEVSVAELIDELDSLQAVNDANAAKRQELIDLRAEAQEQLDAVTDLAAQLSEAEQKLANLNAKGPALRAEVDALEDADVEGVRTQIAGAEEANRVARAVAERDQLQAEIDAKTEESGRLTASINDIDEAKTEAVAAAQYPIEGLAVTDDGVTLDGLPFAQASQSDRLKASVAIGIALNPELGVILARDGSRFDDAKLAIINEMAEAAGVQVIVEVVGDRKGATVVIEDGVVKS